jgi:hypothetical protein
VSPGLLLVEPSTSDLVRSIPFVEWLERWHEFYLMAGTAAVTLAGLLFVALSLHLDRFVEKSHEHLLALARVTLLSFTFVLFASLAMLMPPINKHQTALMIGGVSLGGLAFSFRVTRAARHHDEAGFSRGQMRRRLVPALVGYVMMLLTAVGLYLGIPESLYFMVGGTCMILGNAAGTSWDLLVQIAKQRRASQPV